jgi:hypothetical protein
MIHTVATEPKDTPRSVTSFELAAMIRDLRASDIIRASGQNPHSKAGHMTAAGQKDQNVKFRLPIGAVHI